MAIAILAILGLCAGSFVNALVWRLHEQEEVRQHKERHAVEEKLRNLSILKGRSMCPECRHELAARDLIPLLSWLWLRGKCRYCHQHISWQYPLVEAAVATLFVVSYVAWPDVLRGTEWTSFSLWLVLLVGLAALLIYDLRWMLLPNKLVFPLLGIAALRALIVIARDARPGYALLAVILAMAVGGGIFYILFQFSGGKWIGGGDVKLGLLLGLVVARPSQAFLLLFLASLLGTLAVLPAWLTKRVSKTSRVPFGPFLITACVIALLWGPTIIDWYQRVFQLTPVR
ncbi:MAG TPA: prepilin peptidase [Candidatus Saccharimonadales bacterium]|nr:prepilin peptidase [Candidatus Saccharimonadales bacterium]